MARPYRTKAEQHTTGIFPAALYEIWDRWNRANDYEPIDVESFVVPGAANDYSVELDFGILQPVDVSFFDTDESQELSPVVFDETPSNAEVAVKYDHGLLKFHPDLEGHLIEVLYTPLGSPIIANFLNEMQVHLRATQVVVATLFDGTADLYVDTIRGAWIPKAQTKSATFTADASVSIYFCSGTYTIVLPTPTAIGTNARWTFKNTGTGVLTLDPAGSVTIDGAATYAMSEQYETIEVVSDGTNYFLL